MSGYAEANLAQKPDLVVMGNAISRGNPEAEAVLDRKLRYCSLPELLKEFFIRGKRSIVVAGTHGKTTTTSLLAWVFEHSGLNPSYLIGGIPNNFSQGARFTDSEWFIIEGDEYDTAFFDKRSKFVHYLPEVAVINNLEFDHADIFPDLAAVQTAFRRFINLIPRNGQLLANGDDPNLAPLLDVTHCPVKRFGLGEANAWRATNLVLAPTVTEFETPSHKFRINLLGELNVRNALAVVAGAPHCGLKNHQIQEAFDTFKGIKRRMEVRGVGGGVTVVDDFGHHPTAIRETLRALRIKFRSQKIWAVFEPRSNTTRRNVFQSELAGAFADADAVVVSEVARLEQLSPTERLDPARSDAGPAGPRQDPRRICRTWKPSWSTWRNTRKAGTSCACSATAGLAGSTAKLLDRLESRPVVAARGASVRRSVRTDRSFAWAAPPVSPAASRSARLRRMRFFKSASVGLGDSVNQRLRFRKAAGIEVEAGEMNVDALLLQLGLGQLERVRPGVERLVGADGGDAVVSLRQFGGQGEIVRGQLDGLVVKVQGHLKNLLVIGEIVVRARVSPVQVHAGGEVLVVNGFLRVQLDRLVVVLEHLGHRPRVAEQVGQVIPGGRVLRIERQRFLVFGSGGILIVDVVEKTPECDVPPRVVGMPL